jgi:hypothetical protein
MHRTLDDAETVGRPEQARAHGRKPRPGVTLALVPSYRLIDMAGSEIGIIEDDRERIELDDEVALPEGGTGTVADVYDDEFGQEGGVAATLAVDDGSPQD